MDVFGKFKQLVKIREILVDNEVFQLHYRVTALLLFGCGGLVASRQHFGDPIDCITRDDVPNKLMDTFCWIHSTFTLPDACNKTVGIEVAHPCVDKYDSGREERVYHKYYQWVYFVLFFQAICFYIPHFIWKNWEAKLLYKLTADFKDPIPRVEEEQSAEQKRKFSYVVRYMTRQSNRGRHSTYFYSFTVCEFLNLVNVILQIYLVDEFLGGTFTTYGLDVINYAQMDQENRVDPMVRVFPRMTKCTFHRYGSSGDVQRYDALCILPLNIINEKIYIMMWFWFVFLAIVTGSWLVYRILTFTRPGVRYRILSRRATLTNEELIKAVLKRLHAGDWFLLSMMCKNMDSQWYRYLIRDLSRSFDMKEAEKSKRNSHKTRYNNKNSDGRELILQDNDDEESTNDESSSSLDLEKASLESTDRGNFSGVKVIPIQIDEAKE